MLPNSLKRSEVRALPRHHNVEVTTTRSILRALLVGAIFTAIVAVIDYFSSGLRLGHVMLGGLIFTVLIYFPLQRFDTRKQQVRSLRQDRVADPGAHDGDS